MKFGDLDVVKLDDGRVGTIVCVFDGGESFEVDFEDNAASTKYPTEAVRADQIIENLGH